MLKTLVLLFAKPVPNQTVDLTYLGNEVNENVLNLMEIVENAQQTGEIGEIDENAVADIISDWNHFGLKYLSKKEYYCPKNAKIDCRNQTDTNGEQKYIVTYEPSGKTQDACTISNYIYFCFISASRSWSVQSQLILVIPVL